MNLFRIRVPLTLTWCDYVRSWRPIRTRRAIFSQFTALDIGSCREPVDGTASHLFRKPFHLTRPSYGRKWSTSSMTCDSRYLWRKYMTPIVWLLGAAMASAQNTPEMRQVLERLDRLERDNRALTEEIRALRQELAGSRAPTAETVVSAPDPSDGQASEAQEIEKER